MSEAVRVIVRARPFNKQEIADKREKIVIIDNAAGTVQIKNPRGTVRWRRVRGAAWRWRQLRVCFACGARAPPLARGADALQCHAVARAREYWVGGPVWLAILRAQPPLCVCLRVRDCRRAMTQSRSPSISCTTMSRRSGRWGRGRGCAARTRDVDMCARRWACSNALQRPCARLRVGVRRGRVPARGVCHGGLQRHDVCVWTDGVREDAHDAGARALAPAGDGEALLTHRRLASRSQGPPCPPAPPEARGVIPNSFEVRVCRAPDCTRPLALRLLPLGLAGPARTRVTPPRNAARV